MKMVIIESKFESTDVHHVISLGAGVQSTVVYLMAAMGEIEPMPSAAIFADTQWEPKHVYTNLDWLESLGLPIPIIRVSAGDLYQNTWYGRKVKRAGTNPFTDIPAFARMPNGKRGMGPRQCTSRYKIEPIQQVSRQTIGRKPRTRGDQPPFLVQWLGISIDEWMRCKDARERWIENAYPLIEAGMSRSDCIAWFTERYPGQPIAKSSCVGCPYHSNREWLWNLRHDPDAMAKTITLDEHLRDPERVAIEKNGRPKYLHSSLRPLGEVLVELDRAEQMQPGLFDHDPDGFGNECEGFCNT